MIRAKRTPHISTSLGILATGLVTSLLLASPVGAQWDPESGDTGEWTPPADGQPAAKPEDQQPPQPKQQPQQQPAGWQPPPPQAQPPAQGWQPPPPQPVAPQQPAAQQPQGWYNGQGNTNDKPPALGGRPQGGSDSQNADGDHAEVKGRLGISFYGIDSLKVGSSSLAQTELTMPKLGFRFWLADSVGLDIGLGIGFQSLSNTDSCFGGDCSVDEPELGNLSGTFGLGFQLGLPIALNTGKHHALLFIPELGVGFGSATILQATADEDIKLSGLQIDAGVRVGAEVHFGALGLPNLSLQLSVGLALRYSSRKTANNLASLAGAVERKETELSILSVHNNLLNGSIRLNYYF